LSVWLYSLYIIDLVSILSNLWKKYRYRTCLSTPLAESKCSKALKGEKQKLRDSVRPKLTTTPA
jgi:hypothetical protein